MWLGLNGGLNASSSFCAIGSYGVSSGAATAARMTSASSPRPATRVQLSPTFCNRMPKPSCNTGARGVARPASSTCSLIRHSRIEKGIREVYDEIDDDDQRRAHHCNRLDDGIIAAGNRSE